MIKSTALASILAALFLAAPVTEARAGDSIQQLTSGHIVCSQMQGPLNRYQFNLFNITSLKMSLDWAMYACGAGDRFDEGYEMLALLSRRAQLPVPPKN